MESILRGPILPVTQPVFGQNAGLVALCLGILALNTLTNRFWCRYLCPLGALLGLLSKISFLRPFVRPACNRCGHCISDCRLKAIGSTQGYDIVPTECTVCEEMCPTPEKEIKLQIKDGERDSGNQAVQNLIVIVIFYTSQLLQHCYYSPKGFLRKF